MEHSHCVCGAAIPECARLHVDDVEWESLVTEPASVTVEDDTSEPVDVDVDVDVHIEEESSHEEEHEHESSHESESHEESDEDEDEEEPPDGEVVVGTDSGLPEMTESERKSDGAHSLPMMRS